MDYWTSSAISSLSDAAAGAAKHVANAKYGKPEVRYVVRTVKRTVVKQVPPAMCITKARANGNVMLAVAVTAVCAVGITLAAVKLHRLINKK